MLQLVPLATSRVDRIGSPSKVDCVGCLVAFQPVAAFKLSPLARLRILALNLGDKLCRQCSTDSLGGLFFDSSLFALLGQRIGICCCPSDVEDLVVIKRPKRR